ncbi:inhibitor of KinA [Marininema halotolerans]|uniref:Inhibitor of KinA n=2 Tax=Marininema halotolerans TaxID=1155944 RepID=A0A1I6TMG2_9BACL|nr:inhibitor of KinA [Marininema halotolerans]
MEMQALGDTGVRIHFGEEIDEKIHKQIQRYCGALQEKRLKGVIEWVPSYTAVSVYYRPDQISFSQLKKKLLSIQEEATSLPEGESRSVDIPVVYGGEYGPDLDAVARHARLTPDEVIAIHSQGSYLVYMMGFVPGFPYLGGMDPTIATPRLKKPRSVIPVGSVGIAGGQTGIYPLETPGGWRLIGRTPIRLYDPHRKQPMFLQTGDQITFTPITVQEYDEMTTSEERGSGGVHK